MGSYFAKSKRSKAKKDIDKITKIKCLKFLSPSTINTNYVEPVAPGEHDTPDKTDEIIKDVRLLF